MIPIVVCAPAGHGFALCISCMYTPLRAGYWDLVCIHTNVVCRPSEVVIDNVQFTA